MRAITVAAYGDTPEIIDVPRPDPGPGEVLVQVVAAGLNPLDWKIADGLRKDVHDVRFPLVLGVDGAGTVAAVGPGERRVKVGDRVFGSFYQTARGLGSYAEYAIAGPDDPLAVIPSSLSFARAAAAPIPALTAYGLLWKADVDAGQKVLVIGATGGVGRGVVQLGANLGAHVIGTAGDGRADALRGLGAAETVGRDAGELSREVYRAHPGGVDVIVDLVHGTADTGRLASLLRPGGTYISAVRGVDADALTARDLRGMNFAVRDTPQSLGEVAALIEAGRLDVAVDRERPLEDAPAALAASRAGEASGRTVLLV
ncbi:NADP-dependent oxidoreductase [Actinomadura parmotrematis]|uniref:NADP-dependent oxidoreductase n=1 Tax=Actinomadura parmotrematis TaxID=2864039 RepID=A0ABS7FRI9_9ACTN|nr:NADP-dependent oxidoreductase [Actinomadura parmotrematis]MBW8483019.1 NADP-dependent oxidoreductase [Actinomadura parmotrematis]